MDDDDLIPISALQHYLYCPRQCALIHIERQWADNRQTAEGNLLHRRADQPQSERRNGVRTVTAMLLLDPQLGITGMADVVAMPARSKHSPRSTNGAGPNRTTRMRSNFAHRRYAWNSC